jgi:hypothetical protein
VPFAGDVVPFVLKTDGDAPLAEGPQAFAQPIIELALPLAT